MRVCKFLIDLTHHDRGIPRRFVVPVGVIEFQHFLLSGCVRGRRFVRGRLGSGGVIRRRFCRRRLLLGAADHQRAKHRKRQKQSKYSFHHWFVLLFCYLQVFLHDTYSTRFCPPSQWTALRCACVLFCPCAARAVFRIRRVRISKDYLPFWTLFSFRPAAAQKQDNILKSGTAFAACPFCRPARLKRPRRRAILAAATLKEDIIRETASADRARP